MTATLEKNLVGDMEIEEGATPDVVEEEQSGHIAHSKSAEEKGLPGQMRRPIKVTVMGAGSGFTPTLVRDVLQIPGEQGGTIALVDIDSSRLDTMHKLIQKVTEFQGKTNWKVEVVHRPDRRSFRAPTTSSSVSRSAAPAPSASTTTSPSNTAFPSASETPLGRAASSSLSERSPSGWTSYRTPSGSARRPSS